MNPTILDSLKLSTYGPALNELSTRLKKYEAARHVFKILNPASTGLRFDSRADFEAKGWLEQERNVRIYSVEGHKLTIMLCEEYALKLDEIRSLRLALAEHGRESQAGIEVAQKLDTHAYGKKALLEDLLVHIDELPDSSYLNRVIMLDERNVEDVWLSQTYLTDFISSAAVEPNGDLLLFKRETDGFLRDDLFHEWGHRLEKHFSDQSELFELAIALEATQNDAYQLSHYAGRNNSEHWAVAVEHFLGENVERFVAFLEKAPVRAAITAGTVKKALAGESADESKQRVIFLQRVSYAESISLPKARKFLESQKQDEKSAKLLASFPAA